MAQMFLLARLGRDVEVRFTPNGDAVAELALAYNYGRKGNDGKQPSQWLKASLWGKRAESLAPYLLKGQQLSVTLDDPHIETYEKRDGGQGFNLVGRVSNIEFAGSPPQGQQQQAQAAPQRPPQQSQRPPQSQPQHTGGGGSFDDFGSDVPFNRHHGGRAWACFQ